ncbi:MAG TPA: hypothetical protein PKC86_01120 [Candidatus Saccharibacteria bacterium]|nr:hypothetical protein [Candidatus Saccharibacteria bacterium]
MAKTKKFETASSYTLLDPKVQEEATLLNQAYDLRVGADKKEKDAEQLRVDRYQEFNDEVVALMVEQDIIDSDELLRRYYSSILKLDQSSLETELFNKMMDVRARLKPGVYVMGAKDSVWKITKNNDSGDADVRPILGFIETDKALNTRTVSLHWSAVVTEKDERVDIFDDTIVGREAILKKFNFDIDLVKNYPEAMSRYIRAYEKLGELDKAQRFKDMAVEYSKQSLEGAVFGHGMSNPASDIPLHLTILSEFEEPKFNQFLDRTKKDAARNLHRNLVEEVIKYVVRTKKESKGDMSHPTALEVAQARVGFIEEGELLLAAEEPNS